MSWAEEALEQVREQQREREALRGRTCWSKFDPDNPFPDESEDSVLLPRDLEVENERLREARDEARDAIDAAVVHLNRLPYADDMVKGMMDLDRARRALEDDDDDEWNEEEWW